MKDVLKNYYPKALMSELALYMHRALLDLYNAFPSNSCIDIDNLLNLGQVVDCLIQITDTRNRRAVFEMKAAKDKRRKERSERRGRAASRSPSAHPPAEPTVVASRKASAAVSDTSSKGATPEAARMEAVAAAAGPSEPVRAQSPFEPLSQFT
eukprot:CAMPEP_0202918372 /NCGR_PEP_ID=MMETSP1392-20130828/73280_1 /ASSEMBLY_ACC=CAM_ASM_000868 /TAXON_ID=225041 /ORGANISM="Chlamydomonas chlamydogama, Strain SAG 11-48b" /LENGTH=152 /DNA_ID=CAMNT_0049611409 /DNA_START=69 /DNA_END=523 /DNA_ORIENTATION=-